MNSETLRFRKMMQHESSWLLNSTACRKFIKLVTPNIYYTKLGSQDSLPTVFPI